jgi:hypothetical protein
MMDKTLLNSLVELVNNHNTFKAALAAFLTGGNPISKMILMSKIHIASKL